MGFSVCLTDSFCGDYSRLGCVVILIQRSLKQDFTGCYQTTESEYLIGIFCVILIIWTGFLTSY